MQRSIQIKQLSLSSPFGCLDFMQIAKVQLLTTEGDHVLCLIIDATNLG